MAEITYYIYHIPGKKIGVSKNVKGRIQKQGYTMEEVEVLEEHTNIHRVSLREQELQKEYGYKIDRVPYWKSYEIGTTKLHRKFTKNDMAKGGKIVGKRNVESGHIQRIAIARRTPIKQYTKSGEFIKEFISQAEAVKELNLNLGNLNEVLKGKRKSAGGFVFKYKEELAC